MKKYNNKIISDMLNLESSLNQLKDKLYVQFIDAFSNNDKESEKKIYYAQKLVDSMIEIEKVIGELL